MIQYVEEVIYGINVYRFKSNQGNPYQLTIQEDIHHKRNDVSLIDIYCLDKHLFDKDLRIVISHILYKFLKNNKHYKLFFDMNLENQKDLNRFYKFHRWSKQYDDIKFKADVTKINGSFYIEAYISLV